MNNTNVYLSQRLATNSDKFHLSCLIEEDMTTVWKDTVWLEFTELRDENYPNQTLSWDNSSYLWNELTQYLENKVKFTLTEKQLEEFKDIHEYMNLDNCFDLLELLSTAKQLNWHE
jgi:hypothetical protein